MVAAIGQTIVFEPELGAELTAARMIPGRVGFWEFSNRGDEDVWVQFFDKREEDIELGTTTPTLSIFVPAKSGNDKIFPSTRMPKFTRALYLAATTTPTGADGPAAGIIANLILHDT